MGLVVVLVDGDPELFGGQFVDLGEQPPGMRDRLALEVVAKREIAQHLKEGVVAGGVAHVLQVVVLAAGAHAALRGGGPHIGAGLPAEEDILELHHAAVGKQQGGVVGGHQWARGHHGVPLSREEIKKFPANLAHAHHGLDRFPTGLKGSEGLKV